MHRSIRNENDQSSRRRVKASTNFFLPVFQLSQSSLLKKTYVASFRLRMSYMICGLAQTRLRHPSLPFVSLPYPTRTICRRVRTYVRSVNHVTTKRKEVDRIP